MLHVRLVLPSLVYKGAGIYMACAPLFNRKGVSWPPVTSWKCRYSEMIVLMAEILHQVVGSCPILYKGLLHPTWLEATDAFKDVR